MSTRYVEDVDGRLVKADTVTAHQSVVVPTEPVATALREFVQQWKRERPPQGGRFGSTDRADIPTMPVLDYLAERSGLDGKTIEKHLRRRTGTIDHGVADALLTAIDRPDVLDMLPAQRAA